MALVPTSLIFNDNRFVFNDSGFVLKCLVLLDGGRVLTIKYPWVATEATFSRLQVLKPTSPIKYLGSPIKYYEPLVDARMEN